MKSRDQIYINFNCDESNKDLGLVLSFRQSLMTTYILYNGMSYMGHMFSDFFAKSEREGILENDIMKHLGGVDVYQWDEISQSWLLQGSFNETGPIAFNKQILPFKRASKNIEVKLKLEFNKGLWKFDYAGLAVLEDSIQPYKIQPHNVTVKSQVDDESLELLNNEDHLISMPGSNYKLSYNIPNEHDNYELFIASQGYYLEWMRESWLDDVDIPKVLTMKYRPKKFLKDHALDYKKYESISEELFGDLELILINFPIMSSKSILTILLLTILLFQGCKLPEYLPTYYEYNKSPYGCYIKAKRHGYLGEITGELLLCDETDIYVLRTDLIGNPVHKFEKSSIKKWKVSFYKSSNIRAKFIPAVSIPTIAHGIYWHWIFANNFDCF